MAKNKDEFVKDWGRFCTTREVGERRSTGAVFYNKSDWNIWGLLKEQRDITTASIRRAIEGIENPHHPDPLRDFDHTLTAMQQDGFNVAIQAALKVIGGK